MFNNVHVSEDTHEVDVSGTGITDDCETPNSSARMGIQVPRKSSSVFQPPSHLSSLP